MKRQLASAIAAFFAMILIVVIVTTQPFVLPMKAVSPPADQVRLKNTVRQLSENLYPRSFDQPRKWANDLAPKPTRQALMIMPAALQV